MPTKCSKGRLVQRWKGKRATPLAASVQAMPGQTPAYQEGCLDRRWASGFAANTSSRLTDDILRALLQKGMCLHVRNVSASDRAPPTITQRVAGSKGFDEAHLVRYLEEISRWAGTAAARWARWARRFACVLKSVWLHKS